MPPTAGPNFGHSWQDVGQHHLFSTAAQPLALCWGDNGLEAARQALGLRAQQWVLVPGSLSCLCKCNTALALPSAKQQEGHDTRNSTGIGCGSCSECHTVQVCRTVWLADVAQGTSVTEAWLKGGSSGCQMLETATRLRTLIHTKDKQGRTQQTHLGQTDVKNAMN